MGKLPSDDLLKSFSGPDNHLSFLDLQQAGPSIWEHGRNPQVSLILENILYVRERWEQCETRKSL